MVHIGGTNPIVCTIKNIIMRYRKLMNLVRYILNIKPTLLKIYALDSLPQLMLSSKVTKIIKCFEKYFKKKSYS